MPDYGRRDSTDTDHRARSAHRNGHARPATSGDRGGARWAGRWQVVADRTPFGTRASGVRGDRHHGAAHVGSSRRSGSPLRRPAPTAAPRECRGGTVAAAATGRHRAIVGAIVERHRAPLRGGGRRARTARRTRRAPTRPRRRRGRPLARHVDPDVPRVRRPALRLGSCRRRAHDPRRRTPDRPRRDWDRAWPARPGRRARAGARSTSRPGAGGRRRDRACRRWAPGRALRKSGRSHRGTTGRAGTAAGRALDRTDALVAVPATPVADRCGRPRGTRGDEPRTSGPVTARCRAG